MDLLTSRRMFLGFLASTLAWAPVWGQSTRDAGGRRPKRRVEEYSLPKELAEYGVLSVVLGRVSDRSVTVSALAAEPREAYLEYGTVSGAYSQKTEPWTLRAGEPAEAVLAGLQPDTEYFCRLRWRKPGAAEFAAREEGRFRTQRAPGGTFTFAIQGDSHPERPQMNDPELYARTLRRAAADRPDFYICLGDDFSIDTLRTLSAETVGGRYLVQRPFLGLVAAPLFLVNGNHEQASLANYNQAGVPHEAAVWAQTARNRYYPMPGPDGFYSGDALEMKGIGLRRDYYAWTWGDALFVVLDNYWHSPAAVDNPLGGEKPDARQGGQGHRDGWGSTLGDAQYQWLKKALEQSKAKHKFVFAHHVLGTGRGGTDLCDLFEWGGKNRRGESEFKQKRPGWELPIHALLARHGVTIFFQGHDHLYARQERDGVIYQEVPMPADQGYQTYNAEHYATGTKLPNSGYLRVTVAPEQVTVEYVRCYLPKDENAGRKTGEVAHRYVIRTGDKHE